MAGVLALVGGIGLMGTLSINVLERTREIGVLRAIGASNGSVAQLVIVEGLMIGGLSWLAGMAMAYPLSCVLSSAVGIALIRTPLENTFAWSGVVVSLVVVVVLAAVASFLPAWNATRSSVRAALSYE
jgi:putative ABC transport system permease protein